MLAVRIPLLVSFLLRKALMSLMLPSTEERSRYAAPAKKL